MARRRKQRSEVDWVVDDLIKKRVTDLVTGLSIDWVDPNRVYCVRSSGSTARAYARIWGMNRVWQIAAGFAPAYVIEVVSEHFDKLDKKAQDKVLLHEIAHIPKNFTGSLLAHTHSKGGFHDKLGRLERLYDRLTS